MSSQNQNQLPQTLTEVLADGEELMYLLDEQTQMYLPELIAEELPRLGQYGRKRLKFLREHKPTLHEILMMKGQLNQHLTDIDKTAQQQETLIIEQMKHVNGVDENLKSFSQMEWVQQMNNLKNRAEEIVLNELIYS